jgi:hypothetical protein
MFFIVITDSYVVSKIVLCMINGFDSKKTRLLDNRESFKRGKEVNFHLSKGWCPINPATKSKIIDITINQPFDSKKAASLILKDSGFCTLVLRNLRTIFPDLDKIDPLEALIKIEQEKILELIRLPENSISKHSLKRASTRQTLEIKHNVYALTATEKLADTLELNSLNALWFGYCQELGMLLTAWNYPEQYSLAVVRQKKYKSDLNQEIEKLINISTIDIVNNLFREWRLDFQLGKDEVSLNQISKNNIDEKKVALLGATWSRAQDPKQFPESADNFECLSDSFKEVFGSGILVELEGLCKESFREYQKLIPSSPYLKPSTNLINPNPLNIPSIVTATMAVNDLNLFQSIDEQLKCNNYEEALRILVDKIVPRLGFARGCLFLLNTKEQLVPLLRFGDYEISAYSQYFVDEDDGFKNYIFSHLPTKIEGLGGTGNMCHYICAGLDDPKLTGVLYLEIDEEQNKYSGNFNIACFKIARKLLIAVLNKIK